MPKDKGPSGGAAAGWLSSLKLTLILFFSLAAASLIGTLLPQGLSLAELERHFSPAVAAMIDLLALNNLYHSLWFRILLLLLCANLVACTLDRLPKTVRLIRRSEDPFDSQKLSRFSLSFSFAAAFPREKAQAVVQDAVRETFGRLRETRSSGPFCAVTEKGRWSRLMVYGVHISVLIVLAGALAGSYLGFKGAMELTEGETSDKVMLAGGESVRELPFKVRCDKFRVSFYDTGAPKEFRSDLSIIDKGNEVLKKPVIVNHPLTYKGITFYQANYGTALKGAEIELTGIDSGKKIVMNLPMQQPADIPGTSDRLTITEYLENPMRLGQAIELTYTKDGRQSSSQWIGVDRPFHGNRIENYQVRVVRTDTASYTGLEVKKDPGIRLVWAGFILMTVGIGLTFYSSHTKLWVCIEPDKSGEKSLVVLAGRTSRNAPGFEEKFGALCARLEKELENPHTLPSGKGGNKIDTKGAD